LAVGCQNSGLRSHESATRPPLFVTVDLNVGETRYVELRDGSRVALTLLDLKETHDTVRGAVRKAIVEIEIDGQRTHLTSGTYNLPKTVASVQIDCPVTRGYTVNNTRVRPWGLEKDARLRLWPAGSPLTSPGTFVYPVVQRWFASDTQMANEPVFVDPKEVPGTPKIYYHYGLDIGGVEGMVDVLAATSGLVVSSKGEVLRGYEDSPIRPRHDTVGILDERGWYYHYTHLKSIEAGIKLGARVNIGQEIGILGKEGNSGGWSHLHFDISSRQPSGKWGTQEGYAFLWEAYQKQHKPVLIAVARPHHVAWTGQAVTLDGTRSWSRSGNLNFEWLFTDGSKAFGPKVDRVYEQPGEYSEILKVTDTEGRVSYDFAVVQIFDRSHPKRRLTTIHAAYYPTLGIQPGDPVTFKVRSFGVTTGEVWDFGDGSAMVHVKSDGNAKKHAEDGYAITTHRFAKPGNYLVRVEHTNPYGVKATARLHVTVRSKTGDDKLAYSAGQ